MTLAERRLAIPTDLFGEIGETPSLLRVCSYRLTGVRFSPGQPAFAYPCADERAPGHKIAGEPPGMHSEGRYGRDQLACETSFPERLSPHIGPLGMVRVAVQEQHAQGIEMAQKALAVRAGLVPVAQDV